LPHIEEQSCAQSRLMTTGHLVHRGLSLQHLDFGLSFATSLALSLPTSTMVNR
jgi:hypothetical protein